MTARLRDRRLRLTGATALALMTCGLAVALARVAQLQIAPGEALVAHLNDHVGARSELGRRGDLLDRRGRLIAGTRLGKRLFIDPLELPDPYDESILAIARAVDLDPDEVGVRILPRVAQNERRRAEGLTPIRYVSIGGVLTDAQAGAVQGLGLRGVHLEDRAVRETPGDAALATLIGKVDIDHHGALGAERALEFALRATPGRVEYVHDAFGRPLWIEAGRRTPAEAGEDVRLSIDMEIQRLMMEELRAGVERTDAAGGRAIVVDPLTGEILAMGDVSRDLHLEEFSATRFNEARAANQPVRFRTIAPDPRRAIEPALGRNRCLEDTYEPGSTFKPFVWAIATALGHMRPEEVFETHDGVWKTPYGRRLEDVHPKTRQTWREALVNSSNIALAQGAARVSHTEMRDAILRFGFGARTGLGLPGESAGIVTRAKDWSASTQTSVSFGYEIGVSPLQMVRAFSVFARPGRLSGSVPELRLTAAPLDEETRHVVRRVLPAWVVDEVRAALRVIAERMDERTGPLVSPGEAPTHPMFGKSGTAEIARPDGKGYLKRQHVSSFIAGVPADDPRLVILVIIDDPGPALVAQRRHFGSWTAGPVVRRIAERGLRYMGVAPAGEMVRTPRSLASAETE